MSLLQKGQDIAIQTAKSYEISIRKLIVDKERAARQAQNAAHKKTSIVENHKAELQAAEERAVELEKQAQEARSAQSTLYDFCLLCL